MCPAWAGETAQRWKGLVLSPDNPSSVSGTHTVKGENQLPQVVL